MSEEFQKYWSRLHLLADLDKDLVKTQKDSLQALCLCSVMKIAVEMGDPSAMKSCIRLGISINAEIFRGKTALILSIDSDKPEIIKTVIECGADINLRCMIADSPLHYAVDNGKLKAVEALLDAGGRKILINSLGTDGLAPIHRAVKRNQKKMVRILACHGADLNLKGEGGITPLIMAGNCDCGSEEI